MSNRRRAWIGVFLFTLTTINYMDRVALSVAAKSISAEFHLTPVQMGYLLSSFLWIYIICLIPVGALVDRFGAKLASACGIAIWSTAVLLSGMAPNFLFMGASRMLMGMGESTTWPACARTVREWFPASERGFYSSIYTAGGSFGLAIGAILVSFVIGLYGWRIGFFVAGACGFVWLVLWLMLFNKPERVGWITPAEREKILGERDAGVSAAAVEQRASRLGHLFKSPTVWGFLFSQGCITFIGYTLSSWLPSYLQATRGASVSGAGLLTAIPFAGAAVLSIGFGFISDRILTPQRVRAGQRRQMLAVMLVVGMVILLVPMLESLWAILLVFTLATAACFSATSLNYALVTDLVRNRADLGKVTAITVVGGNLSGIAAPIATGYILAATGSFNGTFVLAGVLSIIGLVLVLTLVRRPIEAEGFESLAVSATQ